MVGNEVAIGRCGGFQARLSQENPAALSGVRDRPAASFKHLVKDQRPPFEVTAALRPDALWRRTRDRRG